VRGYDSTGFFDVQWRQHHGRTPSWRLPGGTVVVVVVDGTE
jgi:hypothetical protein